MSKFINWEDIRRRVLEDKESMRSVARLYDISEGAIRKHIKRLMSPNIRPVYNKIEKLETHIEELTTNEVQHQQSRPKIDILATQTDNNNTQELRKQQKLLQIDLLQQSFVNVVNGAFSLANKTLRLAKAQDYDQARKLSGILNSMKLTIPDVMRMMSEHVSLKNIIESDKETIANVEEQTVHIKLVE